MQQPALETQDSTVPHQVRHTRAGATYSPSHIIPEPDLQAVNPIQNLGFSMNGYCLVRAGRIQLSHDQGSPPSLTRPKRGDSYSAVSPYHSQICTPTSPTPLTTLQQQKAKQAITCDGNLIQGTPTSSRCTSPALEHG